MRPEKSILRDKLDKAWAEAVKKKANYMCEYCSKKESLNAHHIYSRSKKSTRWDTDNGVCLCVAHHTFSSTFSAHKTPTEFTDWIKDRRDLGSLKLKANTPIKFGIQDLRDLLIELTK